MEETDMPVDIALHPVGRPIAGNLPLAPGLPLLQSEAALAEDTPSAELVVPGMGAYLALVATVKLSLDIRLSADAASLDPSTSGIVLAAEERTTFFLPAGDYKLETTAYS
jgi:hypothetical protein